MPVRVLFLAIALTWTGTATSYADTNALVVNDVIGLESAAGFDIAPDGRRFVWVKETTDLNKNKTVTHIYLTLLDGKQTIQLTRSGTDSAPGFSPDGSKVAFLGERDKDPAQIYVLDLRGGEPERVTSVATGVTAFAWIDEQIFLYTAREDSTLRERTFVRDKDDTIVVSDQEHDPPVRLFRYDMKEKKTTRVTFNSGQVTEFALSPDRRWVVTSENQDVDYDYNNKIPPRQFLIDLRTSERREICAAPHVDPFNFKWDRVSAGFYCRRYVASDTTDTYVAIERLYYFDVARSELRRVDVGDENGLGGAYFPYAGGILVALAAGVADRIARVSVDGDRYRAHAMATPRTTRLAGARADGDRVLLFEATASSIPELLSATVRADRFAERARTIDLNEALKKKTLARREIIRWAGALGDTVEGIVYYPPAYERGQRYPCVAWIHGGPASRDEDFFDEREANYPHVLAARGVLVLKVNYHGSKGYGLRWLESIKRHYYEYEVPDIQSGIDYLIARGDADPERLGIMGWSNGSILAIACAIDSNRFRFLCAGAGDVNWTSDYGNCAFGGGFDSAYMGGPPWELPDVYIDKSPLFRMKDLKTPTLIMFGTVDRSVPTEQGWQHFRAMQTIGAAPVRFILFPGAAHHATKLSQQKRKMEEELKWIDTYLFEKPDSLNEAFDDASPLARALEKAAATKVGFVLGQEYDATIIPEVVEFQGIDVGRFEVTRAQFAAYDPNFSYPAGTENYPVTEISPGLAQAYCLWLTKTTGSTYRLPTADEMNKLLAAAKNNIESENTLAHWIGYTPTPEEAALIAPRITELEKTRTLIEPAGSFAPAGKVYDLVGNVAEWVNDGTTMTILGGSAVTLTDDRVPYQRPPLNYVGFRVVRKK